LLLLEQTFDKIFELNASLSTTIQNSRYGLQNEFLSSVIQGKFSSEETFHNACKNLNIVLDKKYGYIDENGNYIEPEEANAYKFESFIFDAFKLLTLPNMSSDKISTSKRGLIFKIFVINAYIGHLK